MTRKNLEAKKRFRKNYNTTTTCVYCNKDSLNNSESLGPVDMTRKGKKGLRPGTV